MRRTIAHLCLPLLSLALAPVAQAEQPVAFTVQADKAGAPIDRQIFGQFAEHLGTGIYGGIWVGKDSAIPNVRGIRSDVVGALRAIHVPNVRWPGGCYGDEYHWRKGIGAHRQVTLNSNWGGVPEPDTFGTDEYFDFLGQIGAEAYVSINVGSGTPQEAAEWMEYMTTAQKTALGEERAANGHPAPYKVPFMGVGNENWGCGGSMTPEHYVDLMKVFAHFTHNTNPEQQGANAMKRIAVGSDGGKLDYTDAVMKAWSTHDYAWNIEGVSIHNYTVNGWPPHLPATGFGEADYAHMLKETLRMDDLIARQSAIMDKYDPSKKVFLSVDEWGAWLAKTPGSQEGFLQQQNSLRDAVLAALNLNIFMRHADRVKMANIAQMINVLQAMILTDGPKMVLTPTYHVYKLYVPFQDATFVPVKFDAGEYKFQDVTLPRLDAVAARDKAGKLWLAVTNVDPNRSADIAVAVEGAREGSVAGEVLTAAKVDAVNTFEAPNAVAPKPISGRVTGGTAYLTLPPKSVAVVALN